jgi:hypothetical protein
MQIYVENTGSLLRWFDTKSRCDECWFYSMGFGFEDPSGISCHGDGNVRPMFACSPCTSRFWWLAGRKLQLLVLDIIKVKDGFVAPQVKAVFTNRRAKKVVVMLFQDYWHCCDLESDWILLYIWREIWQPRTVRSLSTLGPFVSAEKVHMQPKTQEARGVAVVGGHCTGSRKVAGIFSLT